MQLKSCYEVFRRFYSTFNYSPLALTTPQFIPTCTPKTTSTLLANQTKNWQTVSSPAIFDDQWSKLCYEGRKLIHYSTSQFDSKYLDNQEITDMTLQLKKLAGTNHPLLKTAKRLMANGNSISSSTLIVLLLAKAFQSNSGKLTTNHSNIFRSQCLLAEMAEVIKSAYYIHRSVLNLDPYLTDCNGLVVGNKMSVLSGDYLLASVWNGLCELKNSSVVELMASSISNLMEGQFIRESESIHDYKTLESWEKRNFKLYGSLLANSCHSIAVLADKSSMVQSQAYNFGLNFALAWQIANEMKPFLNPFSLTTDNQDNQLIEPDSTPILLHLLSNQDTFIQVDFAQNQKQLYHLVRSGQAIEITREMKNCYALSALNSLKGLPNNDSFLLLSKFVTLLMML